MKKENKILLVLFIVLVLVLGLIHLKRDINYEKYYKASTPPFESFNVLGTNIPIINNTKRYEVNIDCSKLHKNTQIISYINKEGYKDYYTSIETKVFKKNKLLKESYKGATSIETTIATYDEFKTYEHVYIIKGICK